jgi:hypothetical protein
MKERIATGLTVLVIAGILAYALIVRPGGDSEADSPDAAVSRMHEAAKRGDIVAYLDCFTGRLRDRMEQAREDMGDDRFRRHLQETAAQVKGIAVSDQEERRGKARMRVEFVHAEFHEAQWISVRVERGQWRIYAMGESERVIPPVKYGTPVIPLVPGEETDEEAPPEDGYGEPGTAPAGGQ